MNSKLTAKHLVRAMYIEAEEHIKINDNIVSYFMSGFNVCIQEGMDQLEYWRSVVQIYPNLADIFYDKLSDTNINENIKSFLRKVSLLK